ncbi:MAG TPA: class I tRNA ligase family protein, partial [Candidatus Saccharimonadales bacterium]|nr:class I tRNA ligase family protein [Candidatus Saccharimonadales bacterium]
SVGETQVREAAKPITAADHWILDKLRTSQEKIMQDLDTYRLSEAYESLYHFVWDDVADWYIEASKASPNKPLLQFLLEAILTLAHPFAPFVTETIWQTLAWEPDTLLATRTFLTIPKADKDRVAAFNDIQAIVGEVRFIISALKVAGITLYYTDVPFLRDNAELLTRLARLQAVTEVESGSGMYLTSTTYTCWLDIDSSTAKAYLKELDAQKTAQEALIKRLEDRLANKKYVEHAPKAVVNQTKTQLAEAKAQVDKLWNEYQRFNQ